MARLPYASLAPEAYKRLRALSDYLLKSGLGEDILNLVYLRISQINGCPYCVDLHRRDAIKAGEDPERLNGVVLWRDMPFFTDKERAALSWAEAATHLRDQRVPDEEFESARHHFTDKELVDLTFAVANMNALNRIAIAMHQTPTARKQTGDAAKQP